jgi:monoamine oxidase
MTAERRRSRARSVDVCVVGAGLAGLTAARRLREGGARVAVLEARDRVGGRTHSTDLDGVRVDLGGQWIGPTQTRMEALVEELAIPMFPTFHTGRKVLFVGDRRSTYTGDIPSMAPHRLALLQATLTRMERLCRRVGANPEPWTRPDAARWDGESLESWLRRNVPSAAVRGVFDAAVRTVFGADPGELSLLHALYYFAAGGGVRRVVDIHEGAQERRFVPGAQSVALALAEPLGPDLILDAPVRRIETTTRGGMRVVADAGEWTAKRVVVAVPPAMAGRIAYDPPMPALRDELTQRYPMGATIKFHAVYERPFWRDEGYSGEAVLTDGPLAVAFDNSPPDGSRGALLAFSVGSPARRLGALSEDARRRTVLAVLVRCFGDRAGEPVAVIDKDWSADPWTRGCPTGFAPPGVLSTFGPALRPPVGAVHWAGTETATEWTGYMEGAVRSGERASAEVLAAL